MNIKPAHIERDKNGYWTHPELPEWDEGTKPEVIDKWFSDNGLTYAVDEFEHSVSATEEMHKAYFDNGSIGAPDWEPLCAEAGAFLLSIHDTEGGPVAVFAVPKTTSTESEHSYISRRR